MIIGLEIFFGTNFFVNLSWNLLARASVVVVVLVLVVVPVFK